MVSCAASTALETLAMSAPAPPEPVSILDAIPPPDVIRSRIGELLREEQVLRDLLRVSEAKARKLGDRKEAACV
jgi:hypothetical protein